jgi:hypothetical protein
MRTGWLVAALVMVSLSLAACSGGGAEEEGASGERSAVLQEGGGEDPAAPSEAAAEGDEAVPVAEPLPALRPRVIQTASLTLSVPRRGFQGAVDRARTLATSFGGFVVGSTAAQGRDRRLVEGTLVLRVPERSYARAIRELSQLGRVEAREESGQDVSQEFVDLEARGRHLEAVERQLLGLLGEADTVAEALAVQSKLNQVQLDLEQARGRLQYLSDQVAFATISLSIHERRVEPEDDGEAAWGIVDAWRTAAHAFLTVVGWMLIAAATAAPFLLLLALAVLGARFAARRGRLAWRRS